jgi:hypothetical protein
MKKFVLILAAVLLSSLVVRADDSAKKDKDGFQTVDMKLYNNLNSSTSSSSTKPVTVTQSCTENTGKEVKQGDAGYDACLIKATSPNNPANNNKTGVSNSVNINFGK